MSWVIDLKYAFICELLIGLKSPFIVNADTVSNVCFNESKVLLLNESTFPLFNFSTNLSTLGKISSWSAVKFVNKSPFMAEILDVSISFKPSNNKLKSSILEIFISPTLFSFSLNAIILSANESRLFISPKLMFPIAPISRTALIKTLKLFVSIGTLLISSDNFWIFVYATIISSIAFGSIVEMDNDVMAFPIDSIES